MFKVAVAINKRFSLIALNCISMIKLFNHISCFVSNKTKYNFNHKKKTEPCELCFFIKKMNFNYLIFAKMPFSVALGRIAADANAKSGL
jgi:hypothetical protein